jgi:hypothetical protein
MKKVYPTINHKQITAREKKAFDLFEKEFALETKNILEQRCSKVLLKDIRFRQFLDIMSYNMAFNHILMSRKDK